MIKSTPIRTASGHLVLQSTYSGDVSVEEARNFIDAVKPGGPYDHHGHLVLGTMLDVSKDVRKVLGAQKPHDPNNPLPVALVVPSAMMRMVVSLVMRASENPNTEFFKDEAQALAFLDRAMAEYERKRR
jgi:uncharacterized linocin/CFP29 family protein